MVLKLSHQFAYRPLPEGAAVFNNLASTTQLIGKPFDTLLAILAESRESNRLVKKADILAALSVEQPQLDEFIEQAVELGIIEVSTITPAQ
ncbi:hypothetical protein GCM10011357_32590 [Lacimicrobium alkaliphilum]|uniref:Uncharacterized protein n=1 Tax=Lacimicrobium alkaliphilum TaxID=1526571 RepID=A0ABQ1RMP3_9ALTE|nr:hypothetical protein GCM10011357_32590 [Lacimicrobium alkaliphilum]